MRILLHKGDQADVWKQARLGVLHPEQKQCKHILLNSLAAVISKNKRDVAGNSVKVVHPWVRHTLLGGIQFCRP